MINVLPDDKQFDKDFRELLEAGCEGDKDCVKALSLEPIKRRFRAMWMRGVTHGLRSAIQIRRESMFKLFH